MSEESELMGYKLVPIYWEEFSGFQPQAFSDCPVSGQMIPSVGDRNDVLHKSVVALILKDPETKEYIRHALERNRRTLTNSIGYSESSMMP